MKMEITGKRYGAFTNKQGESVTFRTLYVKTPLKARNGTVSEGYTCDKIGVTRFFTDEDMKMLSIGDEIDVTFNQFGSVEDIEIC